MEILTRLEQSFQDLERAISTAKTTLLKRNDVPQHVLDRLASYDAMVVKQKGLAEELRTSIINNDAANVTRVVNLINGLSGMIRDDARELLTYVFKLREN